MAKMTEAEKALLKREKRRRHNVAKMVDFFTKQQKSWLNPRHSMAALLLLDEHEMLKVLRFCSSNRSHLEVILKYANTHSEACAEMSPEDVREAQDLVRVTQVHES